MRMWPFLLACTSLAFSIDPTFTDDQQMEIRRAAESWNAITETPITFDGDAWRIVKRDPGAFNGLCRDGEKVIFIRPRPVGATTYAVALHEFGHALDLRHVTHGVMDPVHVTIEFSVEDIVECRRVGVCR